MRLFIPIFFVFLIFSSVVTISCSSKNETPPDDIDPIDTTSTIVLDTVVFSVIGDVPYTGQREGLISMIQTHNAKAKSEFVVHVGDIKPGSEPCDEAVYKDVNGLLKEFTAPTFMLLGDNEYNDCAEPKAALKLWNQYFLNFHENWTFQHDVINQPERLENFGWVQDKVIFVGLNIVGSAVHDQSEWDKRLSDNAEFLQQLVTAHKDSSNALVVFGHANIVNLGPAKFKIFTDVFRAVAKDFSKPVLHLQGDGHFWIMNQPYNEKNILRVQIEGGAHAVQVTVNPNLEEPFSFDREFLD